MIRFFILLLPIFLFGHKINLFVELENKNLFINSYFGNGKACINCYFIIEDENENTIFENSLDENGEYNYKTELKTLKVTVDAGAGHIVSQSVVANNQDNEDKAEVSSQEIENLKEELRSLKRENELLKQKLDYFELFKIVFGLAIIFAIFVFIRRVKK